MTSSRTAIPSAGRVLCAACAGPFAQTDSLTGLADRARFTLSLEAALDPGDAGTADGGGENQATALLLLDLDRFKSVNDTLGHIAGDALLKAVGGRLRSTLREDDVAARLGGDEFAIILKAPLSQETIVKIATRLVDLLAQPYLIDDGVATIGTSIGAALSHRGDGIDAKTLLRHADLAMYQAKAEGRGRYCFFEPALRERAEARRLLEFDLRAALALGQFELFYQPQLELSTDRLVGFEALIRWRHPVRGLVPPDAFIPLAEELGLIASIGEWVIRAACIEASGWAGEFAVAVNVAAAQFDNGWLVPSVMAALQGSGLPGDRLELEITETVLLKNTTSTVAQLNALKALGVQISLDDFGTGYSSLTQLRSFPFNRVKIDRSFADDVAVVRAVAALGASLGMRTTAEGVETPEQLARLRNDGCTEAQGFLLSRPVPGPDVASLIRQLGCTSAVGDDAVPPIVIQHQEARIL